VQTTVSGEAARRCAAVAETAEEVLSVG
jgi:hypothetical protein